MNAAPDWMRVALSTSTGPSYERDLPSRIKFTPAAKPPQNLVESEDLRTSNWQGPVEERVASLLQLKAGWDSYAAMAPSIVAARALLDVLNSIMPSQSNAPSIVPSSMGHFQAEWHTAIADLEVEVITATRIVFSYVNTANGTVIEEKELSVDLSELSKFVAEVTG